MGENESITRREFDNYRKEVEGKFDKLHSENQQILIELAKIGERIGNFNEKFSDMKASIDGKFDSFRGDVEIIQNEFRNNLREPRDRLTSLKWAIATTVCTGLVTAILTIIIIKQ